MYIENLCDMTQITKETKVSIFIDYFDEGILIDEKHFITTYSDFIFKEVDNLNLRHSIIEEFRVQDMEVNSMKFTKIMLRFYEGTD